MPKPVKQPKRPTDFNQIAHYLVEVTTEEPDDKPPPPPSGLSEYMAAIGRKGGKKGGKARLKTMSKEERRNAAAKAAKARWAKQKRKN